MTINRRKLNDIKRELNAAVPDFWSETLPPQPSILPPPMPEPFIVRGARRIDRATDKLGRAKGRLRSIRLKNIKNNRAQSPAKRVKIMAFTTHAKPKVSIIIPVFNKFDLTLACLESIKVNVSQDIDYEVIVVDNASSDSSYLLAKLRGLHYVRNNTNEGFVGGCNIGAFKAKGQYLVFLNNDALVTPGWLESLFLTLTTFKNAGLVGSKIMYPDGRLQEAGGIIYKDGTGCNYGKNDHPDRYQYNYVREVDYCSGASIIIAKVLFDNFGGFDELYSPAYYEDTDLAFKVRKSGLRVLYQPESVIYHIEGATSGTDINSGFKKFQSINHRKFVKRWATTLKKQYGSDEEYVARDRSHKKLVLIVDEHIPTPDKDSGSVRMTRMIQILQNLGYKVTFFPNYPKKQPKYTQQLQQRGVEVVYGPAPFDEFIKKYGASYDAVILSRPRIGAYYLDLCQAFCSKAKIIYDTVDLHYVRLRRQADFETKSLKKYYLEMAEKHEILEKHIITEADTAIVVSGMERSLLNNEGFRNVEIVSNIHVIDNDSYTVPFTDRKDLLFVGGFAHIPNIDAIEWFVAEVFPSVLENIAGIKLHVVGSEMPDDLRVKLEKQDGVIVDGFVENLEPLLKGSRLLVAPMRYGAGVKGKIGQAIEYGLPVVTTGIGAEGMYLRDKESALIGDTPTAFAMAVCKLYSDEVLWQNIRSNARQIIETYFSEKRASDDLKNILT